jgi:hypothetical protein
MAKYVRDQWPRRRWAVEGANGMGRPLAQRLLSQGETVLDVPAKLAARVRVFDTGNARKTDATMHPPGHRQHSSYLPDTQLGCARTRGCEAAWARGWHWRRLVIHPR